MSRHPWELPSGIHAFRPAPKPARTPKAGGRSASSATQQRERLSEAIRRFVDENPIVELLESQLGSGALTKAASTNGGEWEGPCPLCGGMNRLRVWPDPRRGAPRAWCRQCEASGDALHWAVRFAGKDPGKPGAVASTLRELGLLEPLDDPGESNASRPTGPRPPLDPKYWDSIGYPTASLTPLTEERPCRCCFGTRWWRIPSGPWTCIRCHPPMSAGVEVRDA